jgi:hypothetical protein
MVDSLAEVIRVNPLLHVAFELLILKVRSRITPRMEGELFISVADVQSSSASQRLHHLLPAFDLLLINL